MICKSTNPHEPSDVVLEFEPAGLQEIDRAVAAAESAQLEWAAVPAIERSRALANIAREIESRRDELISLQVREIGKPIRETTAEVRRASDIFDYYAQLVLAPDGETYPSRDGKGWLFSRRYPLGVVGLIAPWNSPVGIQVWKSAPALAYGNGVVLKPAPESPAVATLLHEMTSRHLPDRLFQIVVGDAATGKVLVEHAAVGGISFTGSVGAGRAVAVAAVKRGAKIQCEMGGQNASVVLVDADQEHAARTIAHAMMFCAGQKCTATSRVIVESDIYPEFRDRLVQAIETLEVVDPSDQSCTVGPLIHQDAVAAALAAVEGVGNAGQVLTGGSALDLPGFYMQPTLVELEDDSASLAKTEVFGPVGAIIPAKNAEEAVQIANDVEYGLSTALFTQSLSSATTLMPRFESGMVRTNASTSGLDHYVPFGGIKASSMGPREQGPAARDFYTESRTLLFSG